MCTNQRIARLFRKKTTNNLTEDQQLDKNIELDKQSTEDIPIEEKVSCNSDMNGSNVNS